MLKDKSTFRKLREEVIRRENASCVLVNHFENKLHTQRLEISTQSSAFEAVESDLQTQFCHAQWECRN